MMEELLIKDQALIERSLEFYKKHLENTVKIAQATPDMSHEARTYICSIADERIISVNRLLEKL